jgi:hypothetical protein
MLPFRNKPPAEKVFAKQDLLLIGWQEWYAFCTQLGVASIVTKGIQGIHAGKTD